MFAKENQVSLFDNFYKTCSRKKPQMYNKVTTLKNATCHVKYFSAKCIGVKVPAELYTSFAINSCTF
jgi:hypothetical protein